MHMRCVTLLALGLAACGSDPTPLPPVDADRYAVDLEALAAQPRQPNAAGWKAAQELCIARFEELGYTVELHAYATGLNVIGTRLGTSLPDEKVVVSAHYDSVTNCAGADDNASGVAGVLEAARVLAVRPSARTLVVACWDEEERGLIGSRAWVQREVGTGSVVTANYVFEMIGYRSSEPNSQELDRQLSSVFPDQSAAIEANDRRGDFILVIHDESSAPEVVSFTTKAAAIGLPTIVLPVNEALTKVPTALRRSDHASFWDVDWPGVQVTDTAEYRNSHYHCTEGPDVTVDVDVAFATMVTEATVAAVAAALDP
jgi:Zn-dependent M28 family amino/carboxypeptidase